jgi:hypothetical protein
MAKSVLFEEYQSPIMINPTFFYHIQGFITLREMDLDRKDGYAGKTVVCIPIGMIGDLITQLEEIRKNAH